MKGVSNIRMLLVEPEAILADLTSFRLELLGYQIKTVSNAAEMQAALTAQSFNLVMIDAKLPDADGIDVVAKLRQEWNARELPILVLSIESTLDQVERAVIAGAQGYLVIPFDPQVFEEKVQRLLDGQAFATTSR